MSRRLPIFATCMALAVPLAACGGDDEDQAAPASGGSDDSSQRVPNSVEIRNIKFEPAQLTVKVGDTVTWINKEEIEHNVVAEKGASFKSETFGLDGRFEFKTEKAGRILYVCTLHPGQDGTIVVE